MLKHLTIKNYALIRHLEMQPSGSLNVITGETGAGKSIMLGALGMLMGNRAETKVLWEESEKCVVEAVFDIKGYKLRTFFKNEDLDYDDQTVIRREISAGGKSRAFVNDTPVTLDVMRKLGSMLMDIHSQHETLQLGNQVFQLQMIDAYAENSALTEKYHDAWSSFLKFKREFESLRDQAETLRQEADYTKFQLDELTKADLSENEQQQHESEMKVMEHAEEIKTRFRTILDLLSSGEFAVQHSIREIRNQLQGISGYAPSYETLFNRLESVRIELDDIEEEIKSEEDRIEFDPERSEWLRERLSTIYNLLKKHRVNDVKELLEFQESLQRKADLTGNLDQELAKAESLYKSANVELRKVATQLSESRKKASEPLKKQLVKLLRELGIPDATLAIDIQAIEPGPSGSDKIEMLFSANKGISPKPLAQVASGGEFSRLMFCIKYVMAEKSAMPTLVLDEIDNGVSGEIAIKLGNMMKAMSKDHQLITITHLPQIAAKGDAHYFVFKDNSSKKTVSNVKHLNAQERVEEIAKMIGGATPSKIAMENAMELLRS